MRKYVKFKLATVLIDYEEQQEFERMGIDAECEELFDADCYVDMDEISAFYENKDTPTGKDTTTIILSSGENLNLLIPIDQFIKIIEYRAKQW